MSEKEDEITTLLRELAGSDAVDADRWAAAALAAATPLLERAARRAYRRRVAITLATALVPLPLILLYDRLVLEAVYGLTAMLLPQPLPAMAVGVYALAALLLLGGTYAAIPLLVESAARPRRTIPVA